jgi:sugar phosphate isomerase/epimerase
MYKKLSKKCKNKYPFKVSCPSYIYPEDYIENVTLLGPHVDEIELLFFEGNTPEFLPTKDEITKLKELGKEFDITYNIHLPTDLSVTSDRTDDAKDNILEIIKRVKTLDPSTYTLHLPFDDDGEPKEIWYERSFEALEKISGVIGKSKISVETLNYNPEILSTFIDEGYSMCLDIGHVLYYGFDLDAIYTKFKDKITTIHLHGVERKKDKIRDHKSLKNLSSDEVKIVKNILHSFGGVVSFEVFSYKNLEESLIWLDENIMGVKK